METKSITLEEANTLSKESIADERLNQLEIPPEVEENTDYIEYNKFIEDECGAKPITLEESIELGNATISE